MVTDIARTQDICEPGMLAYSTIIIIMKGGWSYLSISKIQWLHFDVCFGMDK